MADEEGADVPAFKCSDGRIVPKKTQKYKGKTICKDPELLYGRCVHNSRLGSISIKGKPDVEILFSCRKYDKEAKDKTYADDTSKNYHDVAVIQHNKKNGATCFYQKLGMGNSLFDEQPAPRQKRKYWGSDTNVCVTCHTSGPFIRTPHYRHDSILSLVPTMRPKGQEKYFPLGNPEYTLFKVDVAHNKCTTCHAMYAWQKKGDRTKHFSKIAEIGAGRKTADITVWPKTGLPTKDGRHAFMANNVGGLKIALKAMAQLEACANKRVGNGCTVKQVVHGSFNPSPAKAAGGRVAGHWGKWAKKITPCPKGTYAFAFRQRVEGRQGRGDDSALNAVQLRCRSKKGGGSTIIKSRESTWGRWSTWQKCAKGHALVGFHMRIEKKQGRKDDSAANDVRFVCSNGRKLKANVRGPWGAWRKGPKCPKGQAITGFRTRVEGKQGRGDDSAMNGMEIVCGH